MRAARGWRYAFREREAYRLPVLFWAGDVKANFDWADPLLLEASLREDEKLVQATARRFADDRGYFAETYLFGAQAPATASDVNPQYSEVRSDI